MWLLRSTSREDDQGFSAEKIHSFERHTGLTSHYANLTSCITAIIFGAIHCTAWVITFPNDTERFLWMISSFIVIAVPVGWLIQHYSPRMARLAHMPVDYMDIVGQLPEFWIFIFQLAGTTAILLYILSRFSLIVLAFLTLRNLPLEALETVQWTTFIPHV
ncbi:hypothetical protein BT96DRAFT_1068586 [Gymnopus androsaceus JB14]|uniref:Uncharacterized protein n=1 Tax=Gymnopus androsaceus JB14 TaxID=1447944 RepID=A0A6A4I570_9AGAR|nr:hypothetical protein BT96DRAFT_1068586 [Gymnopus androsaceus JB14]